MTTNDRNSTLKVSFNEFWSGILGDGNYYDKLSLTQFVDLKMALSDINNIITLKTTNLFVDKLQKKGVLNSEQCQKALSLINGKSANANGYDVKLDNPHLIAEVKCNIPVNRNSFGAAQHKGIVKDIHLLHSPDSKTKANIENASLYFRFMVLLDCPGARESMAKIISEMKKENIPIIDEPEIDWSHLSSQCVYIVYVSSDK